CERRLQRHQQGGLGMTTAWLHIIGVGERGPRELSPAFKLLLSYAENVIGPRRFLDELEPVSRPGASGDLFNPELVTKRSFEAVARALAGDVEEASPHHPYADGRNLIEWESPLEKMVEQILKLRDTPTVILA